MLGLENNVWLVWCLERRQKVRGCEKKVPGYKSQGLDLDNFFKNVQSVVFGQLAGAREDGVAASHGLGYLHCHLMGAGHEHPNFSRFLCCIPPPALLGVSVSPQEPSCPAGSQGTPQSCCSTHLSFVSKTMNNSITNRSLLLLLGNVCKNQYFLCSINNP